MTERDTEHLRRLDHLADPSERAAVSVWWWQVGEEEREFSAGLSAAAAAQFNDPGRLYAYWRRDTTTDQERRYVEDLIARVTRHLQRGTGARRAL